MSQDIKILQVKTKKQINDFVNFPNVLYKNIPYYVPKLYSEELKIFSNKNPYNSTCESIFFNAYQDGEIVGRIQGILQKSSNELRNEKRVRFTRFDIVDNFDIAKLLLDSVEQWAFDKSMDIVFGPLGYSDLEPEGLLVEGFDQLSTFFETYNFGYYQNFIEKCGYKKEVDWIEHKLSVPDKKQMDVDQLLSYLGKQSNFKIVKEKTVNQFLKKYKDTFMRLIDDTYKELYQTVPLPIEVADELAKGLNLIGNPRYIGAVLDENENPIAFGIAFPSIVEAVKSSNGHLYPSTILKILNNVKHPKGLELGLIGVLPEYRNSEAAAMILLNLMKNMKKDGIKFAETNLNLEDNEKIISQWKNFDTIQHKRRRCYIKKLI